MEAHIFRSMENVCLDTVIAYKTKGRKVSFLENYDAAGEKSISHENAPAKECAMPVQKQAEE